MKKNEKFGVTFYDKESTEELCYKDTLRIEFYSKSLKKYRRGELVKYFVKRIEEKLELKAEEGKVMLRGLRKCALFWKKILNLIKSYKENIGEIDVT